MNLKLGKKEPKFNPKTLLFRDYLPKGNLPTPLAKRAWEYRISDARWAASMLGNDLIGDCVIAAILHYIMAATANTGNPATFTTQDAIDIYSAITGYDPAQTDAGGNNPTDNGTVYTDALAYWQKTGFKGHFIKGWTAIDPSDLDMLKQGVAIFGGVLVGTSVTQKMMDDFQAGNPWNNFSGASIGGHGIPWLGFGGQGQTCITWAKRQSMSPQSVSIMDEAYVPITQDWLDASGESPSGYNLAALQADLQAIAA